jgi:hypothetical protein
MMCDSYLSLGCPTPYRASLELMPLHSLSLCIDYTYNFLNLNLNELSSCPSVLPSFRSTSAHSSTFASRYPPNDFPSVTVPLINVKLLHFCATKVLYNTIEPLFPCPSPLPVLQTLFGWFSSPCKLHFIVSPVQICFATILLLPLLQVQLTHSCTAWDISMYVSIRTENAYVSIFVF